MQKQRYQENNWKILKKCAILLYSIWFHEKSNVCGGGYSQIDCELSLLKEAIRDNNDYFHFMSGNDYLLVSEEEFKAFFYKNQGKEFIGFQEMDLQNKNVSVIKYIIFYRKK
mgnify:CR=1 FL=1